MRLLLAVFLFKMMFSIFCSVYVEFAVTNCNVRVITTKDGACQISKCVKWG